MRPKVRLLTSAPELRARMMEQQGTAGRMIAAWLAEFRGPSVDETELRVVATALGAAILVALDVWQSEGGKRDPLELVDEAIRGLARNMRELKT